MYVQKEEWNAVDCDTGSGALYGREKTGAGLIGKCYLKGSSTYSKTSCNDTHFSSSMYTDSTCTTLSSGTQSEYAINSCLPRGSDSKKYTCITAPSPRFKYSGYSASGCSTSDKIEEGEHWFDVCQLTSSSSSQMWKQSGSSASMHSYPSSTDCTGTATTADIGACTNTFGSKYYTWSKSTEGRANGAVSTGSFSSVIIGILSMFAMAVK